MTVSDGRQGLIEVGQKVVDMLDADRQTNHVRAHTGFLEFVRIELAVRGGGRVTGQRLGITDIDQPGEQLQRILEMRTGGNGVGRLQARN